MSFITRQSKGTAVVLKLKGGLTIGAGDIALRNAVDRELKEGGRQIVLDLSELSTIDSSGLGELVSVFTSVTSRGGVFKLVGGPQKLEDLLTTTQLIAVFDVYPDAGQAVAAFSSGE